MHVIKFLYETINVSNALNKTLLFVSIPGFPRQFHLPDMNHAEQYSI